MPFPLRALYLALPSKFEMNSWHFALAGWFYVPEPLLVSFIPNAKMRFFMYNILEGWWKVIVYRFLEIQ